MKPCRYCGRENDDEALTCFECGSSFTDAPAHGAGPIFPRIKHRWVFCGLLALALLVGCSAWLERHPPARPKPGIVVLASYLSNGQQVVTFRPEPPNADVTFAGVASAADDGTAQRSALGSPDSDVPVRRPDETNYTLRFLATPLRSATMAGRPLACTPGSYTVAYTPQQSSNRVIVGVALLQSGVPDIERRIQNAWAQKTPGLLFVRSHRAPVFVVTEPFTNPSSQ